MDERGSNGTPRDAQLDQPGELKPERSTAKKALVAVIGLILVGIVAMLVFAPKPKTGGTPAAAAVPTATATTTTAPAAPATTRDATSGVVQTLAPAAKRNAAAAILTASIKHYSDEFALGQQIVGTTQYPDAATGLKAMNYDPTSAAAKLRDYQANPNPENDDAYMTAFTAADANFTADDEPASITPWRDDMGTLQTGISDWINVAVSYQIQEKGQADLDAAAATVRADLARVALDVKGVAAGK